MFEPGDIVICANAQNTPPGWRVSLVEGAEYLVVSADGHPGVAKGYRYIRSGCPACGGAPRDHAIWLQIRGFKEVRFCPTRFRKKLPPVAVTRKARETIDA